MGNRAGPRSSTATPKGLLTARSALFRAAWFGLVGGAIDVGMIHLKRDIFHSSFYYEQGRHFHWVVPLASVALLMVPGVTIAALCWLRPGLISPRFDAWIFGTLALWGPLLRLPLYAAASLLLALGISHAASGSFAGVDSRTWKLMRNSVPVLAALLAATAAYASGRQALAESRTVARLPEPPSGAGNVLLIVMDTVRAASLSLYGYSRETTPHLQRWATKGVLFEWALAPAPWTFPSHCSFMTGQWASSLNAGWPPTLDPDYPTLAGFLTSRGYLTAGFAANTYWCSYESGMDRGFVHYEDYPVDPTTILGSTVPGRWIRENVLNRRGPYGLKWIRAQSRDAEGINRAFLDWLSRQGRRRPFFAFLNYLDAHEPFIPPEDETSRFGLRPQSPSDSRMLLEYRDRDKLQFTEHDVELARDSYDDCIAALDRQVGALLDELDRRNVLRDTQVIITSDHGEEFGEHGVFNHGFSLYTPELRVPLLIISGEAPPGRTVAEPVSLRDLPATIADLSARVSDSPFSGRSLAECWRQTPGSAVSRADGAYSEAAIPQAIRPERGRGSSQRGFTLSLVAEGLHYLLDGRGQEELYELAADPGELRNLKNNPRKVPALDRFRKALLEMLGGGKAGDNRAKPRMLVESP
jgi:arylsulfatase A-like enzyme